MSKLVKSRLLKYGISGGICAVFVVSFVLGQNIGALPMRDVWRVLSDAFSIPGLLFLFSGLLVWLANEGALDGVGFVLSRAIRLLIPGGALKRESYSDYVARRRGKKTAGYGFLFLVGIVCMGIGVIFMALFYTA